MTRRRYTPVHMRCAGCLHHGGETPPIELPGTGEEFPF